MILDPTSYSNGLPSDSAELKSLNHAALHK